jgi:S-adenosylmethionine:tRNA ribosyltransferase-isomerase
MKLKDFYYELPEELVAQEPLKDRDSARLMVLAREKNAITEKVFKDVLDYIEEGDCLVLNNTQVIPARLYGKRKTGGKVEIFLLDSQGESPRALVRPSKKITSGEEIELENGVIATVLDEADVGRFVKFNSSIEKVLEGGHVPLPPYIRRADTARDIEDYQTVYSIRSGATASPTAGLHFTRDLLYALKRKGVIIENVTLHTSYGTFSPVKEENIKDHKMHSEFFEINEKTANTINKVKSQGRKVFAVGTTSTRVLETSAVKTGEVAPLEGDTDLFITPGYSFKIVDGLITNFHLPESTLLMLVSAFAGRDLIFEAYKKAIENKFRFFSYGDAMLIT